jgi:hemerythrin
MLTPVNVKKIDIGGGLIHGRAEDFSSDASGKLYLSHTSLPLTDSQKEIGSSAAFGQQDVLVPMQADPLLEAGIRFLREYFPAASEDDVEMLGNCPIEHIPPDTIVQRGQMPVHDVFFVLGGVMELIDSKTGLHNRKSAGSFIGELDCLAGGSAASTCRAISNVSVLRIPCSIFMQFLKRTGAEDSLRQHHGNWRILQGTWLFGEMVSFPLQFRIARAMERRFLKEADVLAPRGKAEILLLDEGLVSVFLGVRPIENLKPGGFFGEETLMRGARELPPDLQKRFTRPSPGGRGGGGGHHLFEARALLPSTLYAIPAEVIEDIPVIQWKLMETYERRLKSFRAEVRFVWDDSYLTGLHEIDEQHRLLFGMIEDLAAVAEGRFLGEGTTLLMGKLVAQTRSHLKYEEMLAAGNPDKGYEAGANDRAEFMKKIEGLARSLANAPVDALHTTVEFLKDWIIDHILLEHRRFRRSLQP